MIFQATLFLQNSCKSFLEPDFRDKTRPLRTYPKNGADLAKYDSDSEPPSARQWLIDQVLTECVLVAPNWGAVARPWGSGCPFEAFLDASDERWCLVLCQRDKPGGPPLIIAFFCKT